MITQLITQVKFPNTEFGPLSKSAQEQLRNEFANSPYGLSVEELLARTSTFEKAKFTYWRAEERRRVKHEN